MKQLYTKHNTINYSSRIHKDFHCIYSKKVYGAGLIPLYKVIIKETENIFFLSVQGTFFRMF